ncbi:MAG: zf-HC2 domain-containing protein [Ktedonobacteraceae bacterium]
MNNKDDKTQNHFELAESQEAMLPLLDAYATGELGHDEQERITYHLESCHECQQRLTEIIRLRKLLATLAANPSQLEMSEDTKQTWRIPRSSQFADAVLTEINSHKGRDERMKQNDIVEMPSREQPRTRKIWPRYIAIIAAALCIVILAGAVVITLNLQQRTTGQLPSTHSGGEPSFPPPSNVWEVEQDQTIARNAAGTFAVEYIDVTKKEFRFFYAFSSQYQGSPRIEVISSPPSGSKAVMQLITAVQPLGSLDSFNVGVIHAPLLDRAGQLLTIQITMPGQHTPTWHLAPLKQLLKEPNPSNPAYYGLYLDQTKFPSITFYGPVMEQQVAFFRDAAPDYIFLRLGSTGPVQIITKAEYLAIAGPKNFY